VSQLHASVLGDLPRAFLTGSQRRSVWDFPAGVRVSTTVDFADLAEQANHELADASALEILAWAYGEFGSKLVVASSMADTVLIHLAEQVAPGIDVIFLDTGYHFVETIGTRDAVQLVHNVNVINVTPEQTVAEQDATWGKDLFARDPDQCCALRKVAPLGKALEPYAAWATGLRRADSAARAGTPVVSWDNKRKLIRIAPIATWTDAEVARYIEANSLMINPLLEDGYTSIGCQPCTSRGRTDDPRAGRWAGFAKTECGIHL
jgi:phosphoadenosine phosphosulfate reductase